MNLASSPELVKEKVSEAKLDDVFSLLKNRFVADWKRDNRLSYFKQFFKANYKLNDKAGKQQTKEVDDEIDESEFCSCCGEDLGTFLT